MKRFRLYGGDLRIAKLIEMLAMENYTVFIYGQEEYFSQIKNDENGNNRRNEKDKETIVKEECFSKIKKCKTLGECISQSELVISGIPISKDNVTVYAPFSKDVIRLDKLKECLNGKILMAGVIPNWFYDITKDDIELFDFMSSEKLAILNAIPTVEGTIKIAIEETQDTIHESNIMIFGYGRIGKILCDRLKKMGANVYCVARKESDLAWIREENCIPIRYEELPKYCDKIQIIINTVPDIVINEEILKKINQNCIIIDVASKPGGVDKVKAEMYKIRIITALGIPGKIAPKTAAKYIKDIIEDKIK